jgi:hypothetical protein
MEPEFSQQFFEKWLRHCATNRTVSGSIPGGVRLGIFSVATDGTMCPGVDSASKNEHQGIPLGLKAAGAWGWRPTTLVVPNVKKIRGLNLPLRPVVGVIFSKNAQVPNFMKVCSVGAESFLADGRTDMTKVIVAFRNFADAPRN